MRVMISALLGALLTISLILMPLSAAQAGVAADVPAHVNEAGSHCSDQDEERRDDMAEERHCASCTAVQAVQSPPNGETLSPHTPTLVKLACVLTGLELEIATPPPKAV